ncbi:Golgi transport complex subunit 3 [Coemansia erecta]|nr:Golgi transport complex subunit 3 [Coemansia sp. RSA 2618]KAJ2830799.1 Golgi transport complex subunit 3 [Coemansia erecta]
MAALDEWEQRFALPEAMRSGLAQLQEACAEYPTQLLETTASTHVVGSPGLSRLNHMQTLRAASPQLSARRNQSLRNLARAASPSPRLATPLSSTHVPHTPLGLEPMPAIETTAQFLEWYGGVESRLAAEQDAESHAFAERVRMRVGECAEMAAAVERVEAALDALHEDYMRVCERTGGVRAACAELQEKHVRLRGLAEGVNERLAEYAALAPIARLFNAPGDAVCLDPGFLPALARVQRAMQFIEAHADARDSELYLMRFAQCRARALTLIKMHAQREFRRLAANGGKGGAAEHVRVRAAAVGLRPLLAALQAHSADARQVLADVRAAYFQMRRAWLHAHVPASLSEIAREHSGDDAAALRDWCAFMMNVCADERRVHGEFFGTFGEGDLDELRAHEDAAMAMFHEQVRPRIIREAGVDVLAALSLTLLTYQRPAGDSDDDSDNGDDGLDAFYAAVGAILEDTQQRLVFRAQAFVRAQLGGYRMSRDDAARAVQWSRRAQEEGNADQADGSDLDLDQHESVWEYPPVSRLRWLVSQISGCVDVEVQRGLMDEALAACKQSVNAHGARAVRDHLRGDAEAEQLAHWFVTTTMAAAERAVVE